MTAEEIKGLFKTGAKITEGNMAKLIDFLQEQKGPKGEPGTPGEKGEPGASGKDGASIKSIVLTVNETGKVTGGTATLTNNKTVAITVTE